MAADGQPGERARITRIAATWIQEQQLNAGLIVEPAGASGWILGIKIGEVSAEASCAADPDDNTLREVLAGVLVRAREQAARGAEVKAARYGPGRVT